MNLAKSPFPQWFALAKSFKFECPSTRHELDNKNQQLGKFGRQKQSMYTAALKTLSEGLRKIRTCTLWVVHLANSFM